MKTGSRFAGLFCFRNQNRPIRGVSCRLITQAVIFSLTMSQLLLTNASLTRLNAVAMLLSLSPLWRYSFKSEPLLCGLVEPIATLSIIAPFEISNANCSLPLNLMPNLLLPSIRYGTIDGSTLRLVNWCISKSAPDRRRAGTTE